MTLQPLLWPCGRFPPAFLCCRRDQSQVLPGHRPIAALLGNLSALLLSRQPIPEKYKYYTAFTFNLYCNTLKCTIYVISTFSDLFFGCYWFLTDSTAILGAIFSLISISLSAKSCLSSVAMMDSTEVPNTFTPYFSKMPRRNNSTPVHVQTTIQSYVVNHTGILNQKPVQHICWCTEWQPCQLLYLSHNMHLQLLTQIKSAIVDIHVTFAYVSPQLRAVCPPMESKMPSGRSTLITSVTNSGVTGRK